MSHKRQKRIRQLAKWTHAANQANNAQDVDLFVNHLMAMGAGAAEISRAVKVLMRTRQVLPPSPKAPEPKPLIAEKVSE